MSEKDAFAVGYVRLSPGERKGDQRLGIAVQEKAIQECAKALGLPLRGMFEDLDTSRSTPMDERDGLSGAMGALQKGGVLIIHKMDRLGEGALLLVVAETVARKQGGRIHYVEGAPNENTPEAQFMRTVLMAVSSLDRAMTRARTRAAIKIRKDRGLPVGRAPYGKRYLEGEFVDDEHEQVVIARVIAAHEEGKSAHRIALELNISSVMPRRGKRWYSTQIMNILRAAGAVPVSA